MDYIKNWQNEIIIKHGIKKYLAYFKNKFVKEININIKKCKKKVKNP